MTELVFMAHDAKAAFTACRRLDESGFWFTNHDTTLLIVRVEQDRIDQLKNILADVAVTC